MGKYEDNEMERVMKDSDEFLRVKVISGNHQTNWMNVDKKLMKKIRKILK